MNCILSVRVCMCAFVNNDVILILGMQIVERLRKSIGTKKVPSMFRQFRIHYFRNFYVDLCIDDATDSSEDPFTKRYF